VPQIVGAAGERGGGQVRAESGLAGGVPGAAVHGLAEDAAAGAAEQPAVRRAAVLVEVAAEHADQDRRDRRDAGGAGGAVLEAARHLRLLARRMRSFRYVAYRPSAAGPAGGRTVTCPPCSATCS
jgi:hypothetical protein